MFAVMAACGICQWQQLGSVAVQCPMQAVTMSVAINCQRLIDKDRSSSKLPQVETTHALVAPFCAMTASVEVGGDCLQLFPLPSFQTETQPH